MMTGIYNDLGFMKKIFIVLLGLGMVLSGCQESEVKEVPPIDNTDVFGTELTFTAFIADGENEGTRTVLQADGKSVWWNAGEKINVFFSDKASGEFTSTNTEPQAVVDFQGILPIIMGAVESDGPALAYWAVYPYNAENTCDGESVTMTLPSTQNAVEGSFGEGVFPTVATSENLRLAFYNVCGGARFSVSQGGITRAVFKSADGTPLSGRVRVGFGENGEPLIKDVLDGSDYVEVIAPEGGFIPGAYYFASLLPGIQTEGLRVTIDKTSQGLVLDGEKSFSKNITIRRSAFGIIDNLDNGVEYGYGPFRIYSDNTGAKGIVYYVSDDGKEMDMVSVNECRFLPWDQSLAWCRSYGDGTWEMPFIEDLSIISDHFNEINAVLTANGYPHLATQQEDRCYWSQTLYGSEYAYREQLSSGNIYYIGSDERLVSTMNYCRAVKRLGDYSYIDEYGIDHGRGIEIDGVVWAPVNCGFKAASETDKGYPYGKLYQWGRRFGQGFTLEYDATEPVMEPQWTGANGEEDPLSLYLFDPSDTSIWDWISSSDPKYWNAGTEESPVKTEYDPCPSGWRVPTGSELTALLNGHKNNAKYNGQGGCYFSGSKATSQTEDKIFLPATGCYDVAVSSPGHYILAVDPSRDSKCFYWSSLSGLSLYYHTSLAYYKMQTLGLSSALAIRCVRVDVASLQ